MSETTLIFGIILLTLFYFFVYILPSVVAFNRDHPSKFGILVFNLFLGWTFTFWVIALAWALSKKD